MSFTLRKTRVNANYTQLKKVFSPGGAFEHFLRSNGTLSTLKEFTDLNLESASVFYSLKVDQALYQIEVNFMQTTRITTRCFDVFIRILPASDNQIAAEISNFLEDLRVQYNRTWVIKDTDLSYAILK